MSSKITPERAREILKSCDAEKDFHAIPGDNVRALLEHADEALYVRPPKANGSRARYWHAYLQRVAARK